MQLSRRYWPPARYPGHVQQVQAAAHLTKVSRPCVAPPHHPQGSHPSGAHHHLSLGGVVWVGREVGDAWVRTLAMSNKYWLYVTT